MPAFKRDAGLEVLSKREASIRLAKHLHIASSPVDLNHTRDFELLYLEADYPSEIRSAG